jgi:hypothetical protein
MPSPRNKTVDSYPPMGDNKVPFAMDLNHAARAFPLHGPPRQDCFARPEQEPGVRIRKLNDRRPGHCPKDPSAPLGEELGQPQGDADERCRQKQSERPQDPRTKRQLSRTAHAADDEAGPGIQVPSHFLSNHPSHGAPPHKAGTPGIDRGCQTLRILTQRFSRLRNDPLSYPDVRKPAGLVVEQPSVRSHSRYQDERNWSRHQKAVRATDNRPPKYQVRQAFLPDQALRSGRKA